MTVKCKDREKRNSPNNQGRTQMRTFILVLAGTELISLAAGPVFCFGFSMKIMLVTEKHLGCGWVGPMLSQGLVSVSKKVHKKLRGSTARTAELKLAKRIFEPSCQVYINWGSYLEERQISVWEQFGVWWQVVINGIEHHLLFLRVTCLSPPLTSLPLVVIFYFVSITFLVSRDEFGSFISDSPPYPTGVGVSESSWG